MFLLRRKWVLLNRNRNFIVRINSFNIIHEEIIIIFFWLWLWNLSLACFYHKISICFSVDWFKRDLFIKLEFIIFLKSWLDQVLRTFRNLYLSLFSIRLHFISYHHIRTIKIIPNNFCTQNSSNYLTLKIIS